MTITLNQEGATWIVRSAFADKDIVKAAGCRWNPDRKVWWTDKPEVAAKLAQGDAAAVAAINAEREAKHAREQAAIQASRAASADIAVPAPKGLTYLGYQLAGVAYALQRSDTLIADEMGLGKTIQALGLINADKAIANVLVVCPASLKLNWKREAQKWLTRPLKVSIANGAFNPGGLVIVNYEQVKKYRAQIDAVEWDVLVVDEAHYLKNSTAARTHAILGKWDKNPGQGDQAHPGPPQTVPDRHPDPQPADRTLDPRSRARQRQSRQVLEGLRPALLRRLSGALRLGYGGASHLDELQAKLRASVMIRRMKADVLTELPAKRRSVIAFTPESVEAKAVIAREAQLIGATEEKLAALRYKVEELRTWNDPPPTRKRSRNSPKPTSPPSPRRRRFATRSRWPRCRKSSSMSSMSWRTRTRSSIMAHHHDVIDQIAWAFNSAAVKLDGRMSLKDRDESVTRFQTDPSCRVFVGGIQAAGVGITLTAASHVVFAELDWVPGNLAQAEDRCHRIGQTDSVLVQHLVLDGSLDARMAQIIVDKMDVIAAAVDEKDRRRRARRAQAPRRARSGPGEARWRASRQSRG